MGGNIQRSQPLVVGLIHICAGAKQFRYDVLMAGTDCLRSTNRSSSREEWTYVISPATCKAVHPLESTLSTSALLSIRNAAMSAAPEVAAQCNGVRPSCIDAH